MSEALIVRRGGTGGLSVNAAVIHVNTQVGSTVTLSKGGVDVKVLDSTKGHVNADGNTADYYYSVSANNFGEWTVTGEMNDQSASQTVTVDAAKQYDVKLIYNLYLVKDGKILSNFSWTSTSTKYTFTEDAVGGYAKLNVRDDVGRPKVYTMVSAADSAKYSKLVMDIAGCYMYDPGTNQTGFGCTSENPPTSNPQYPAVAIPNGSSTETYQMDFTAYKGLIAYPYAVVRGAASGNYYLNIVNFYLTN